MKPQSLVLSIKGAVRVDSSVQFSGVVDALAKIGVVATIARVDIFRGTPEEWRDKEGGDGPTEDPRKRRIAARRRAGASK